MATVTGMTAEAMQAIAAASVVSGYVDDTGKLILTTHGGEDFIAGQVKGEKGDNATALLLPQDSETIDLSRTGIGTPEDPWVLRADLIIPNFRKTTLTVSGYDIPTNRWYVKGADGVTYGPFATVESYLPGIGDKTYVDQTVFGTYILAGRITPWKPVTGGTSNRTYNAFNADNQWNYLEYAVVNGFASIRGLLSFAAGGNGADGKGQLVGILPPEARPDFDMVVKINNSDVIRALYIYANGEVRCGAGVTAGGYFSLDGIVYPAAGKATWTWVGDPGSGLAFANGWGHFANGVGNWGKVGFWRDEYDYIWMTGLAGGGTITANTQMIVISNSNFLPWDGNPTPSAAGGEQHVMTTAAEIAAVLNIIGGTTNAIRASAITQNTWVTFCGVHYLSSSAYTNADWVEHPSQRGMASGWVTYAAGYPTFAYRQRPDGLITTKGLIKSGTLGRLDWLPDGMRSERSHLLSNVANAAYCRIDIQGRQQTSVVGGQGLVNLISGSNAWFSLDCQHWFR